MPYYGSVQDAIDAAMGFMTLTQKRNLTLLVSAILLKRSPCLSELARAYPKPESRRIPATEHCLLHRPKRLRRFTDNERVYPVVVQAILVFHTVSRLSQPRFVGLTIDWTMFDTTLPSGKLMRYEAPRIAILCKDRTIPPVQLTSDRDDLPSW